MSVEAFSWALNVPVGGNAKIVLLGLANHAHPDGTETYPSLDTLAGYAHCDRSTARRNLRKLADDGWIVDDGIGPKGQTKWRLIMGGGKTQRVAPAPGGGGKTTPGGVAPVPPEPSIEPSKEPSTHGLACAREGLPNFRARRVPDDVSSAALAALAEWNDRTGQRNRPTKANGSKLTDACSRIVGAMLDYPEVVTLWPRMIDAAFTRPWWSGEPTTGVVFGAKVVEGVIQQAQAPPKVDGPAVGHLRVVGGRERVDWGAVAADLKARGM